MLTINNQMAKINIRKTNPDNTDTTFELSGMTEGVGLGIANLIRIVGYTSIAGIAPVSYRLTGLNFDMDASILYKEQAYIISENMSDILATPGVENKHFYLGFKGEHSGEFHAGLLKGYDGYGKEIPVNIINPEKLLFTVSGTENIEVKILFMYGVGYMDAYNLVSNTPKELEMFFNDSIRLDVDFNPIKSISYEVHSNNPIDGLESVVIEIRTNKTIKAFTALAMIGKVINVQVAPLDNLFNIEWNSTNINKEEVVEDTNNKVDNMNIEDLNLKPKAYNWLKGNNIQCIRDLRVVNEVTGDKELPLDIKEELIIALKEVGIPEIIVK